MECPKSNETTYIENIVCTIHRQERVQSRRDSSRISIYADIIVPVNYVDLSYSLVHRTSNKVLLNVSFEFCHARKNLPLIVNLLLEIFKAASQNLVHDCPYEPIKKFGIFNFSVADFEPLNNILKFKRGDYGSFLQMRDRKGNNIFYNTAFYVLRMKSGQKKVRN